MSMGYKPGQKVCIVDPGTSYDGVQGIVTRIDGPKVWAIWKDDGHESWITEDLIKLVSKFIVGDVLKLGKETIIYDGIIDLSGRRPKLIARKQLI